MSDKSTPTGYHAGEDPEAWIVPGVVAVNPGAGTVANATKLNASFNMAAFLDDLEAMGLRAEITHGAGDEDEGRWPYRIFINGESHEVLMPGLPLDSVRYQRLPGQNAWHYPRLYVDGSSWLWSFALEILRDADEDES